MKNLLRMNDLLCLDGRHSYYILPNGKILIWHGICVPKTLPRTNKLTIYTIKITQNDFNLDFQSKICALQKF